MNLETNNATEIFGKPVDWKLCSSMTLFAFLSGDDSIYQKILDKHFNGRSDSKTVRMLNEKRYRTDNKT